MKAFLARVFLAIAVSLVLGLLIARATASAPERERDGAPPAELPRGGVELLEAVPFVLDQPFVHEWRVEKPLASAGYVLVLRAAPELTRTRETFEPVLYVGRETAERCRGTIEGLSSAADVLIALVPSPLGADGRVALDLETAPIWFGNLELPERVDAARIASERELALARGLGPATRRAEVRTRFAADEAVQLRSREDLEPYVQDLAARYGVR